MKKQQVLLTGLLGLSLGFFFAAPSVSHAQKATSEGIAIDVVVDDKNVKDGSIISLNEGKYVLSNVPYDPSVFGVVTFKPSVFFDDSSDDKKVPVVAFGKAKVRVSTVNGAIKEGDLITTSEIRGVGQKATENGYVIGLALENYEEKDPKKVGSIYVSLHLNFGMLSSSVRDNLIASLRRGAIAPFSSPLNAFRYIVAGVIAVLSFVAGFWFFGRVSSHGVEAIGRNPLARRFILVSVILNVALTMGVMLLGVALAYMILVI
jgi:hypothetical protein